jgi:hypothetical protein
VFPPTFARALDDKQGFMSFAKANPQPTVNWSELLKAGPPIFWRHRWPLYAERFGLPLSRGTMQNRDAQGTGPAKVVHENRVGYLREALVEWLMSSD